MPSRRIKTEPNTAMAVYYPESSSSTLPRQEVEDPDDEVVREISVHLSPAQCQDLFLLQYPLKPASTRAGTNPPPFFTNARIKPKHGMLELKEPLPESLPPPKFQNPEARVAVHTLESHTISLETHMCLGTWVSTGHEDSGEQDWQLRLIPLQQIRQMRPSLHHLSSLDELMSHHKGDSDPDHDMEDHAEDNSNSNPIQPLLFKRKESERATIARKTSYAYKLASQEAEEWHELQIVQEEEKQQEIQDRYISSISSPSSSMSSPGASVWQPFSSLSYVESLNYMPRPKHDPTERAISIGQAGSESAGAVSASASATKTLPNIQAVVTRLTVLLKHGWPVPLAVLKQGVFAGESIDSPLVENELENSQLMDLLFRALSVVAVMVRGNFCLHSRWVLPSVELQRSRTFVLLVLQTRGCLQRERLQRVLDHLLTQDQVMWLLRQVAKRTPRGWELRVEDDLQFVAHYPEQGQAHLQYWERLQQQPTFTRWLQAYDNSTG